MTTLTSRALTIVCLTCLLAIAATTLFSGKLSTHAQKVAPRPSLEEEIVTGRILVKFHDDIPQAHARNIIAALGARDAGEIDHIRVHILDLPDQANEKAFVMRFRAQPEVEFAESDRVLAPAEVIPNDPLFTSSDEWHLRKISAPTAWSISTGSSDVVIAILDTGVDGTHPDLAAKMVPGWNVYDNNSNSADVHGHGTQVAGTAAANTNNAEGVAAVGWGCRLMPIRISAPDGTASYSTMASGLTWAADHGARVANISYVASDSSTVKSAAQYFQNHGGVVVSAAGNSAVFDSNPDNPYILTVSATDQTDVLSYWSSYGNNIDLAAPEGAGTTLRGGGYVYAGGTSISSPIVAGVAALIMSAKPDLTPGQIQNILKQSADDLGAAGWDTSYGWGRVNAARALALATGAPSPTPTPSSTPTPTPSPTPSPTPTPTPTPASDTTAPTISITSPVDGSRLGTNTAISVNASDNVMVTRVELYVDGKLTATSTSSPFTTKWNTKKAAVGAHTLQCKAYDAAGNVGTSTLITVYK